MSASEPTLSFGLPVYNGESTLRECMDSVLAQDFEDFELVVCDNASTDGTRAIIEEYAAREPRIRPHFNDENIGQIANCNRVYELSRGRYYRWIGVSDWIEPTYASECVEALESDPEAVVATTGFRIHLDDGNERYEEYRGERLESPVPARRFARMLWFFHAGDALYDPIYGLMRRSVLAQTPILRMITKADFMLGAELALLGRFVHIPKCLAHRNKPANLSHDNLEIRKRYHPKLYNKIYTSAWQHLKILHEIIGKRVTDASLRRRCRRSALRFALLECRNKGGARINDFRRGRLRLTKANLARLWPGRRNEVTGRERENL